MTDLSPDDLIAAYLKAFDSIHSDRDGLTITFERGAYVFRQPNPQYYSRLTVEALTRTLEERATERKAHLFRPELRDKTFSA